MNRTLEGFGSYRENACTSDMMRGHDNTLYMTGGNTEYSLQSSIALLNALKQQSNTSNKSNQKMIIGRILKLSDVLLDETQLSNIIKEILELSNRKLLEYLANLANLDEPIVIELRRLFYIFSSDKSEQKKKFCHKIPKKCIMDLVEFESLERLDDPDINKQTRELLADVNTLLDIRDDKYDTASIVAYDNNQTLVDQIDCFVNTYKTLSPILIDIEKINIDIAKKLEELANMIQ